MNKQLKIDDLYGKTIYFKDITKFSTHMYISKIKRTIYFQTVEYEYVGIENCMWRIHRFIQKTTSKEKAQSFIDKIQQEFKNIEIK